MLQHLLAGPLFPMCLQRAFSCSDQSRVTFVAGVHLPALISLNVNGLIDRLKRTAVVNEWLTSSSP